MDGEILDAVTEWETVPVDDGAAGLTDLVEREFSGAVSDGVAWLFLLNGRGVGVVDGAVDDFADAELTARRAPDDSLPLLFAMMNDDPEARAEYYSEDTPLSAAHDTLESGGFTGFVELSENVLSGDYYVVYYGGRSLPVAFVGASGSLLTGDEAFERADDEVGIYRVREASVSVLDLPTPAENEPTPADADADETEDVTVATGSAAASGDSDGAADDDAASDDEPAEDDRSSDDETGSYDFDATAALGGDDDEPAATSDAAERREAARDAAPTEQSEAKTANREAASAETAGPDPGDGSDGDASTVDEGSDGSNGEESPDAEAASDDETDPDVRAKSDDETDADTGEDPDAGRGAEAASVEEPDDRSEASATTARATQPETDADDSARETATDAAVEGEGDDVSEVTFDDGTTGSAPAEAAFENEKQWRETQIIPPLSPDDEGASASPAEASAETTTRSGTAAPTTDERSTSGSDLRERLQRAEAERERAEERIESLETERDELTAERDDLEAERDELADEAERLRERVGSLEAEVSELEAALDRREGEDQSGSAGSMTPESALSGTSLFVRYGTKGGPTLEKAHDGDADREAVNENLRLEHHTTFESDSVTVDGDGFESFLHETTEYEFVRWLVEEFIYELQDTDNTGSMQDLYDVLPEVDRVEFGGSVSLEYVENGTEHREQRTFDVVGRDRLGNALVVADINATREATTEGELTSLVEGAEHLAETSDSLAAAFAVTASFFEPSALEVADEVTSSGLLGRSKNKSYVKLSRKRGFHLCLVESRHGQFHVNVPEL